MRRLALGTLIAVVALAGGCVRTLRASITQPNPLLIASAKALYPSQKVYIDVKDMDLPSTFRLRQSAYFHVVSRERLRFRVMLVHKWKEVADVTTWKVRLEDDRGHVYYPESKERAYDDLIVKVWDHEMRTAVRNHFGDIVRLRNDAWKRRVMLASVDVFQGAGDYVFHAKDLFNRGVRRMTLVMRRSGMVYKFTWNLVDLKGDDELAAGPSGGPDVRTTATF